MGHMRVNVTFLAHVLLPVGILIADLLCPVQATQAQPIIDHFSVSRFSPAVGGDNFLATEGANVAGHLAPSAGLTLDYALSPFVIYGATCTDPVNMTGCSTTGIDAAIVNHVILGHVYGSITLVERIQIALTLPVGVGVGQDFSPTIDGVDYPVTGGGGFGLGDPRLSVKGRIYGNGTGITVGASAFITAPLSQLLNGNSFLGDQSITVGGNLIGQLNHSGVQIALNLGGYYRKTHTFFSTRVGPQLTYRLAGGYEVNKGLLVFAELDGGTSFGPDIDENPLEIRLGGKYRVGAMQFHLGLGTGILAGVGVPLLRVLGGGSWSPVVSDGDSDGVIDTADKCPEEPEDKDGFEDEDGCPDADNDADGIEDGADKCRDEAEDIDGFEDEDGCPDKDNDGDGVADGFDSCPDQPEDMDGDRDNDGCPDNDTDQDGIDDENDKCPNEPEDTDGYGDEDGCPEDDFDGDGIPDDQDDCPDEPETRNRIQDDDGCPD